MRSLKRAIERRRRARRKAARRAKRSGGHTPRLSSTLASLTAGVLALPGLAGSAAADAPISGITSEYSFSYYAEADLPSSQVTPGGETERYEVQAHQFRTQMALFDRFELGVDVVHETMSGASPWYVVPDADGDPVQVMTGATIEDARTDLLAQTSYYLDEGRAGVAGGVSWENDYLAFNVGLDGERNFNEGNTTVSSGGGFSYDTIEPTDADSDPFRPDEETKQSYSLFAGVSQVVSEKSVVQSTFNYQHNRGYLSDPYKRVLVAGAPVGDSRPDERNQFTWLTRYRQHVPSLDGTVHLDYRFYIDDWEINSHTVDVAWYQSLWWGLRLIPSFRYYSQSQAEFYAPYFETAPSDGFFSSDYRISPYGALSFRLRAEASFDVWDVGWRAAFGWEHYLSSADFALGKVDVPSPGLVDFDLFTLSLRTRF